IDTMKDRMVPLWTKLKPLQEWVKERKDLKLSTLEVKAEFQKYNQEVILQENKSVGEHYQNFEKDLFNEFARPLKEDSSDYALPEGVHPLILGELLCILGLFKSSAEESPFKVT